MTVKPPNTRMRRCHETPLGWVWLVGLLIGFVFVLLEATTQMLVLTLPVAEAFYPSPPFFLLGKHRANTLQPFPTHPVPKKQQCQFPTLSQWSLLHLHSTPPSSSTDDWSSLFYHPTPGKAVLSPEQQQTIQSQLEQAGLDVPSLRWLAQDFAQRPEAFSSLLIQDFHLPPLVAHQVRAAVMASLVATDPPDSTSTSKIGEEEDISSNDTPPPLPSSSSSMGHQDGTETEHQGNNTSTTPTKKFSGFHSHIVNQKAAQRRRRQGDDYTYGLTLDHSSSNSNSDNASNSSSASALLSPQHRQALEQQLDSFYQFMTQPSAHSQEDPIRPATAKVYLRHARLFMGFLLHQQQSQPSQPSQQPIHKSSEPPISLQTIFPNADKDSVQSLLQFLVWLRTTRQISVSYEANVLRGMIKLLKFRFAKESRTDASYGGTTFDDIPLLKEVRRLHRDANRRQRLAPRSSDEQRKWLSWTDYLQVVQQTKQELLTLMEHYAKMEEDAVTTTASKTGKRTKKAVEIAEAYQRYLILALLANVPDRQRTIRELELGRTLILQEESSSSSSSEGGQSIWCIQHGPDDYKTGKSYGERPLIQLPEALSEDITRFCQDWRPALHPQTSCLLVQRRTGQPLTQDSVFQRVSRCCFKYTGKRTNPHLLRDMLVTHVRDSDATEQELEALALYMGHSLHMQRTSYDRRTLTKKIAPALRLLQSVNQKGVHVPVPVPNNSTTTTAPPQ